MKWVLLLFIPVFLSGQSNEKVRDVYSKKMGHLRFSDTRSDFGRMLNNHVASDTIWIMNESRKAMNIQLEGVADYLRSTVSAPVLPAGGKGFVAVLYDASKRNEFGFVMEMLHLRTNDEIIPLKSIYVSVHIEEYFPPDDSLLPRVKTDARSFDFGRIVEGEKASHKFTISNEGRDKLILHQVKTGCPCMKAGWGKKELMPGESTTLLVEFDTTGKSGKESRVVTLYVNDPEQQALRFEMKGEVVRP
jgi:hypothetical protein